MEQERKVEFIRASLRIRGRFFFFPPWGATFRRDVMNPVSRRRGRPASGRGITDKLEDTVVYTQCNQHIFYCMSDIMHGQVGHLVLHICH